MSENVLLPSRDAAARWLMVIDMQRIFGEPISEWATPDYASAAAGIQRLLRAFDSRTCFTRFLPPKQPTGIWMTYYQRWPFALDPGNAPLYDLSDEFASIAANTLDRTTFGKWDAQTDRVLEYPGEIVLAGVTTDCCVLSTALAATDAGVHVIVAADACAGVTEADHQRALDAMTLYSPMIDIAEVDTILASRAP
ncbi:MAG TPA: cysteine hydrolase [Propionibacteriaceae bacterium]|nr:cysteine hydrolase [Propionibacteriaceae bacterium]